MGKSKKMISFVVALCVVGSLFLVWDFLVKSSRDSADLFNNSGLDITIYPVLIPGEYGDLDAKIQKGVCIKNGESKKIWHDGIFIVALDSKFMKFPVSFMSWESKVDKEFGGFSKRVFQLNPKGELYVLRPGTSRPIKSSEGQPRNFPLKPEELKELKDFKVHISRSSL